MTKKNKKQKIFRLKFIVHK